MSNDTDSPVSLGAKPPQRPDPDRDLVVLATKALRLLGESGKAAEAGALAGKMWWTVKDDDPDGGRRLDAVMHYLARLEGKAGAPEETATSAADEPELDAQALDPSVRHSQIAGVFESLRAGTAFILVNSHDPKPLQYQFEARYAGEFTWDYIESGPEVWKIRIGRPAV